MKNSILALTVAFLPPQLFAQSSQYVGFRAIEKKLSGRIAGPGWNFQFVDYLRSSGLVELLGSYGAEGGAMKNAKPNAVNTLLYYEAFWSLGRQISESCAGGGMDFSVPFKKALAQICKWPKADAQTESSLKNFWIALMGYDAPDSEYFAWRDFFTGPSFATARAEAAIPPMVASLLLNPHFLLQK